ncbi:hypothetical protein NS274_18825 [Pseudomonas oryzihabitans]|uniref:DUF7740 domain-containing protein n=1 Tax=Pseudomonas rhizoryzae TaxID=2571129 RepID=UPI0007363392|nr:hypothetical protein [Pseudomonas rhizoryzae]APQ10949.1 hypothetical protein BJP27_05320 [Pseudomonas psychrotolerans]KTS74643.1 hypothetical protein NS274_18825 [Pseudomonas psychrotolerans]KTT03297.1 hypothetical protein NS376_09635 [Pseudomonas psychrotolerans]KTT12956.1 hypothetical protein NS2R_06850 [Pseudomonas psychrotolerans]KTT25521.1 hypothetical protein SB14R_07250 [Pseudomonas psychrotolerans]
MPNVTPERDLSYCTLALLLAARIHGTDEAVRATARRCIKQLPKRQRDLLLDVIQSRQPLQMVRSIARKLE